MYNFLLYWIQFAYFLLRVFISEFMGEIGLCVHLLYPSSIDLIKAVGKYSLLFSGKDYVIVIELFKLCVSYWVSFGGLSLLSWFIDLSC